MKIVDFLALVTEGLRFKVEDCILLDAVGMWDEKRLKVTLLNLLIKFLWCPMWVVTLSSTVLCIIYLGELIKINILHMHTVLLFFLSSHNIKGKYCAVCYDYMKLLYRLSSIGLKSLHFLIIVCLKIAFFH